MGFRKSPMKNEYPASLLNLIGIFDLLSSIVTNTFSGGRISDVTRLASVYLTSPETVHSSVTFANAVSGVANIKARKSIKVL